MSQLMSTVERWNTLNWLGLAFDAFVFVSLLLALRRPAGVASRAVREPAGRRL